MRFRNRESRMTFSGWTGRWNTADGDYSFAAGQRGQANHDGTFVWSDTTMAGPGFFAFTGPNQFLIRAAGGTVSPDHFNL